MPVRKIRLACGQIVCRAGDLSHNRSQGEGLTGAKFHADQALAAAEEGLHVFVEKSAKIHSAVLLAILSWLLTTALSAEENTPAITVRLVADFETDRLASDLEQLHPVVKTLFSEKGSKTVTLGERATLWVRNAHVDGKFFFERFYQGKYIDRSAELKIPVQELGPGQHVIQPGHHPFQLSEDGSLTSHDPDIRIEGSVLSLRLHRITLLPVDASRGGPAEYRLVAAQLGLFSLGPAFRIEPANLPDPKECISDAPLAGKNLAAENALVSVLSHVRDFYPLSLYLPSNQVGQGYLLYPSWQAFHLTPQGIIDLDSPGSPKVPGIVAEGASLILPYWTFLGSVNSSTGLVASIGQTRLAGGPMKFSPTLEAVRFSAGLGKPEENFFITVDPDFSKAPHKFFLADNTTRDPHAARLFLLEWGHPVFTRDAMAIVSMRFMETGKPTVPKAVIRMAYCPYNPSDPDERSWTLLDAAGWQNGELTFRVPDVPYNFYIFRVSLVDATDASSVSPLTGEIFACVVEKGQTGTASFVTNKGRNAFVTGEDVPLHLVIRSATPRAMGSRTLILEHPGGALERFRFEDPGSPWFAEPFRLPASQTRHMAPGSYELRFEDLSPETAGWPFRFDLAPDQKRSLFKIIKPSKYTMHMTRLVMSWEWGSPLNLDRAVASIAELGYNRIDHMTWTTDTHSRRYTDRENLAGQDPRLMPPESVTTPSPRNQLLNACVRHGIEFSDVLLIYNDFHLPRYVQGYIEASKRWIQREMAAMRHSPALAGMLLYDEMYWNGVVGFPDAQPHQFAKIRQELAQQTFGRTPADIEKKFSQYRAQPRHLRQPEALQDFLKFRAWEVHGWGDYNSQVARAAREVVPHAQIGTYHRTWMGVGIATGVYNGYPLDVFQDLDIISCIHYGDGATQAWVHSSMMAQNLRVEPRRNLFINIPIGAEHSGRWDGQYQRHMTFAMLSQGAEGVSQFGIGEGTIPAAPFFDDAPNTLMMVAKETTQYLNNEILGPFGELVSRTQPGYQQVAIVETMNQHILNDYKEIPLGSQIEGLWLACWRLGFPACFLHEIDFENSVNLFRVIFVPGVRFDGEIPPVITARLSEAIQSGCKVVVEKGSQLQIPGVVQLESSLMDYYNSPLYGGGHYYDDELNKVFEKTQPLVDFLSDKLPQWVEPAARGPFKVGPNWRRSGQIQYLIMANFEDPEYKHAVKQFMARPVRMPLRVTADRGRVAYDLLRQRPLAIHPEGAELAFELDMARVQGGIAAFLPEPVAQLIVNTQLAEDQRSLRIQSQLSGLSGHRIPGVFPTRIRLLDHQKQPTQQYFRVLGEDSSFTMDLPAGDKPQEAFLEIREAISGQTCTLPLHLPASSSPRIVFEPPSDPAIPFPQEVARFLQKNKEVWILVGSGMPGLETIATELSRRLKARGIRSIVKNEMDAFRYPSGDSEQIDPMADGFHSWRTGYEVIQPSTVVDSPAILLGGKASSYLLEGLGVNGFFTDEPKGEPGRVFRPSIQVAPRGLHWRYDTLCLIANDAEQIRRLVNVALDSLPPAQQPLASGPGKNVRTESQGPSAIAPAVDYLTNDECVVDLRCDKDRNIYLITSGHGKNLYSLSPKGSLRFARHLPEAAASRLAVTEDRILVFTSAGARLYQLTLDGKPISQIRLTQDPGPTYSEDDYFLCTTPYDYLPQTRQIIHNDSRLRFINENGRVEVEWTGRPYQDKEVSDRISPRGLHGFALSPDGTRIAQIETTMYWSPYTTFLDREVYDSHLVIRNLKGEILKDSMDQESFRKGILNDAIGQVWWEKDAPGPAVMGKGEIWQFDESLNVLYTDPYDPGLFPFGARKRLVQDGHSLRYLEGQREMARLGPLRTVPSLAAWSPDESKIALLDEYRRLSLYELPSGKKSWEREVEQLAQSMQFSPDSSTVLLGGMRGLIMATNLQGEMEWTTNLSSFNDPAGPVKLYDPEFPDLTPNLWPEKVDEPGDLDALVRMEDNRLVNGDCESDQGWLGESPQYAGEGHDSPRSLRVVTATVSQEITNYIGSHGTWVLEFFYKAAPGHPTTILTAGIKVESQFPDSVARRFAARPEWQFGRIVVKSGMEPRCLSVGLKASEGEALVDDVSLRRIRFPSTNHLYYEPLHKIKPVILTNPIFAEHYNPVGNVKEELPNRILIKGPGNQSGPNVMLVESSFLQNGRLNDMGSAWYIHPLDEDTQISIGFKEARWISLVALSFNAHDEKNVTPHFDIYATDTKTTQERIVASVRHNRQLFRLVRFPPVLTSQIILKLVNAIKRLRTLTEVEVYGPLSGDEGVAGFADPDGQNTYMGSFARVDPRNKTLAKAYEVIVRRHDDFDKWHEQGMDVLFTPCSSQILASQGNFYVTRALGFSERYRLDQPAREQTRSRAGSLGFAPFITLYSGLLLKPGNDGKLYCIDPDSGRELWSVKVGERLQSCPVALDQDLYIATDLGKLYKLDLAGGSILMERPLSGGVIGALATDRSRLFLISHDGLLQAFECKTGERLWSLPVAPYTDSTPAVDGNTVYLADHRGVARAVRADTGAVQWSTDLGQEFTRCPLVTSNLVLFGCRDGKLAALDRSSGKEVWALATRSRFSYEPLVLEGQAFYFDGLKAMVVNLADGTTRELGIVLDDDPMVSMSYYKGRIFVVPRHWNRQHTYLITNHPWHVNGGRFYILSPKEP